LVSLKVYRLTFPKEPSAARPFKQGDSENGLRQDDSHEWTAKVLSALGGRFFPDGFPPKSKLPQDFSSKGTPRVDSRQGSRRRLPSIGGLLAAPKLLYFASMTNSKVRPKNGWCQESPYSMRSKGFFHTVGVLGSNPESPTTFGKAARSGLFFFQS